MSNIPEDVKMRLLGFEKRYGVGDSDQRDWENQTIESEFSEADMREYDLWLEEKYRGISPQQESADELHDYLAQQEDLDDEYWYQRRLREEEWF